MAVGYDLPGRRARRGEPKLLDHIVKAAFQQAEQRRAGIALLAFGKAEVIAELLLVDAVVPLYLLLFTQAQAILAAPAPAPVLLAWRKVSPLAFHGALGRFAPSAFEHQFDALAPAKPA